MGSKRCMDVTDAPTKKTTQPGRTEESQANGVGVLGWIGFVVIHLAAWGMVNVSTNIDWWFGFKFAFTYTGLLLGCAVYLSRLGDAYRSFENLLWVLLCVWVFVLGLYLTDIPKDASATATVESVWLTDIPKDASATATVESGMATPPHIPYLGDLGPYEMHTLGSGRDGPDNVETFTSIGDDSNDSIDGTCDVPIKNKNVKCLSVLFMAVFPSVLLAGTIMAWKRLPGLFAPLYIGVGMAFVLVCGIYDSKFDWEYVTWWFIIVYTFVAYAVISCLSLWLDPVPNLLEEMKDWVMVFAGVPLFVLSSSDVIRSSDALLDSFVDSFVGTDGVVWVFYTFCAILHMLVSVVVQRSLPMVFGGISVCVIVGKISGEWADKIAPSAKYFSLVLYILWAFNGLGLIGGAIVYTKYRESIEKAARQSMTRSV